MKYEKPEIFPDFPTLLRKLLDCLVFDCPPAAPAEPAAYLRACVSAAKKAGLPVEEAEAEQLPALRQADSRLYQLGCVLAECAAQLRQADPKKALADVFSDDAATARFITTFCDDYSGSLKKWLAGNSATVQKPYNAALFFAFLTIQQPEKWPSAAKLLVDLLEDNGITELEEAVQYEMADFGSTSASDQADLQSRGVKALCAVLYICFCVVGRDDDTHKKLMESLQHWLETQFEPELKAAQAAEHAERSWLRDIQYYAPRSITLRRSDVKPQDFYIQPRFLKDNLPAEPAQAMALALKSTRSIVMAKTGMGKTMYLRMLSMCMLKGYLPKDIHNDALNELARALHAPEWKYVIFIPASMFSFCYNDRRYADWAQDLVTLYFHCMFKLSGGYNFYSASNPQRSAARYASGQRADALTPALQKYIQELARQGKLLLLADSFDEIAAGPMRDAYLKALRRFCDDYCTYPEHQDVGAHVIVTSRQMSPATMDRLARAIHRECPDCVYAIQDLTPQQRNKLIENWGHYLNEEPQEIQRQIRSFDENHFCQEFSVNPYMISVLCSKRGAAYDKITQEFISTLVSKTRTNYRVKNDLVNDILQSSKLLTILQNIALNTIRDGSEHFSSQALERELVSKLQDEELTQDMIDDALRQLHEILISAVGLIVPADGEDSAYQFINGRIRYQLAAKAMQRALASTRDRGQSAAAMLARQTNTRDYIGMLIPLLCELKDHTDPALAESLVIDLALRNTDGSDESLILEGIVDLLLGRYGSNITTPKVIGDQGQHTVRSQRILMLRLLSSPDFAPSATEKAGLRESSAFSSTKAWLRPEQRKILNG